MTSAASSFRCRAEFRIGRVFVRIGVFAGVSALEALFAEDVVSYSDGGCLASQEGDIPREEIEEEPCVIWNPTIGRIRFTSKFS
jgi:hypothetical protein